MPSVRNRRIESDEESCDSVTSAALEQAEPPPKHSLSDSTLTSKKNRKKQRPEPTGKASTDDPPKVKNTTPSATPSTMGSRKFNWQSRTGGVMELMGINKVDRMQALQDMTQVQQECAGNLVELIESLVCGGRSIDTPTKQRLMEKIDVEMEPSKRLLLSKAQDLLGADLAELRVLKAEQQAVLDKHDRTQMHYVKELRQLKNRLDPPYENVVSHVEQTLASLEEDSEFQGMRSAERGLVLAVLEDKMYKMFLKPGTESRPLPASKLDDSFKRERLDALQKQVTNLEDQLASAQRSIALLDARKAELKCDLKTALKTALNDVSKSGSSSSPGSTSGVKTPSGRPKSGQPKRAARQISGNAVDRPETGDGGYGGYPNP